MPALIDTTTAPLDPVEVMNLGATELAELMPPRLWQFLMNGGELALARRGVDRLPRYMRARLDLRDVPQDCVLDAMAAGGMLLASRAFADLVTVYRLTPAGVALGTKWRRIHGTTH